MSISVNGAPPHPLRKRGEFNISQAAIRLGVTRKTVYSMLRKGTLAAAEKSLAELERYCCSAQQVADEVGLTPNRVRVLYGAQAKRIGRELRWMIEFREALKVEMDEQIDEFNVTLVRIRDKVDFRRSKVARLLKATGARSKRYSGRIHYHQDDVTKLVRLLQNFEHETIDEDIFAEAAQCSPLHIHAMMNIDMAFPKQHRIGRHRQRLWKAVAVIGYLWQLSIDERTDALPDDQFNVVNSLRARIEGYDDAPPAHPTWIADLPPEAASLWRSWVVYRTRWCSLRDQAIYLQQERLFAR